MSSHAGGLSYSAKNSLSGAGASGHGIDAAFERLFEQCAAFADAFARHPANERIHLRVAAHKRLAEMIPFVAVGSPLRRRAALKRLPICLARSYFLAVAGGDVRGGRVLRLLKKDFESTWNFPYDWHQK